MDNTPLDPAFSSSSHLFGSGFDSNGKREPRPTLVFPSDDEASPSFNPLWFEYSDLIDPLRDPKVTPKKEQLSAFKCALLHNTIAVLPTGFGKTLIAAMVMSRIKKINPNHIPLMLVDRVPLVFQQAEAIERDTGLIVCPLSGETNSSMVDSLLIGSYNAIVATAGSLINYLDSKTYPSLSMDLFSVIIFDECHHSTGNHHYMKILNKLRVLRDNGSQTPRLIGLSASPISADSKAIAFEKITAMKFLYQGAKLYCPRIDLPTNDTIYHPIELSKLQRDINALLPSTLSIFLQSLYKLLVSKFWLQQNEAFEKAILQCEHQRFWPQCVQIISLVDKRIGGNASFSMKSESHQDILSNADKLYKSMEINFLMGFSLVEEKVAQNLLISNGFKEGLFI
jgi:hypothetical protein